MAITDYIFSAPAYNNTVNNALYDLSKHLSIPTSTITGSIVTSQYSTAAAINSWGNIQQTHSLSSTMAAQIQKQIDDAIKSAMLGPTTISGSATNQAVVDPVLAEYPITNSVYHIVIHPEYIRNLIGVAAMPNSVKEQLDEVLEKTFKPAARMVLATKLRQARYHKDNIASYNDAPTWIMDGNTYDPWFRNITQLKSSRYKLVAQSAMEVKVMSNCVEKLFVWVYESTIDGNPVRLFIYDLLKIEYTNKKRTQKHCEKIAPYELYTEKEYDLVV